MTSHWLLDSLVENRHLALRQASRSQIRRELMDEPFSEDAALIRRTGEALEMVVLDLILEGVDDAETLETLQSCSADAFRLFRALPQEEDPLEASLLLLRASALAVLGEMGADAGRLLRESPWAELPIDSEDWSQRTWATVIDIWLCLIRKRGWADRDTVLERIEALRQSQEQFETNYLGHQDPAYAKSSALELIGLYHLTKAAEIFATYMTDGVVEGNYQIHQLLDTQFDRVFAVCGHARILEMDPLSRLLAACSSKMAENSIWTVTRAVNSRVTQFVQSLVDRGRGDRAIFDVLPPQRRTLAEKGLLGSSRRAVVVSLPTSSGKTLIAQFRILQALNQFHNERGWVAYLAPTRTLVNQVARRLRRDFKALGIVVEQVSPALEIDNIETKLLNEEDPTQEFSVLVTTPEKLDLMLRQGLETDIKRPLTLVVVDEAHNIQETSRGLKLELLLATINNECQHAQFLLLTPFIRNAREVARWLGGTNADDVSFSVDWQPNDRVIGVVQAKRGQSLGAKSFDYSLELETIQTTRQTLVTDESLTLPKHVDIAPTFSKASNQSSLAAVTAQHLQQRGPVIVMHTRPDWVWSLANKFRINSNRTQDLSEKVDLVREFLEQEYGPEFPLNELLYYRVGVHHGGLSDEVRALMEWLFEEGELNFLVATTTIAQGVNFPVSGVVMASHQYPTVRGMKDMSSEDFWNIAGRAGRIDQGSLGIVALVADDEVKAGVLRKFINRQSDDLNSALIALATEASQSLDDLSGIVYRYPQWSTFVQYLAHTYRQMGTPADFPGRIEQILRGTLGFEKLRTLDPSLASKLLEGTRKYTIYLQQPGHPLKLVDSTGFSLESIRRVLFDANAGGISGASWNPDSLFQHDNHDLQTMMGVLLRVPELRENLAAVTGGRAPDGQKLALIVKDWVNGVSIPEIAGQYFMGKGGDLNDAITICGRRLFGRLIQTASWGLGALLSITGNELPEEQWNVLGNLPSQVFYGVNEDPAIALRLLGVPRMAAIPMAGAMAGILDVPLAEVRERLRVLDEAGWVQPLGQQRGRVYRRVWRVLEGLE